MGRPFRGERSSQDVARGRPAQGHNRADGVAWCDGGRLPLHCQPRCRRSTLARTERKPGRMERVMGETAAAAAAAAWSFAGRVMVVTGAAQGVGEATAR